MDTKADQTALSNSLRVSASQATDVVDSFCDALKRFLSGEISSLYHLQEIVFRAQYAYGGIVCAPLFYLRHANPLPGDEYQLMAIREKIAAFLEAVYRICRVLKVPTTVMNQFRIRYREVFTVDYLANYKPKFVGVERRLVEFRERLSLRLCSTVQRFFAWLGGLVNRLAASASAEEPGKGIHRTLFIAPAVQDVVASADPTTGVFVLRLANGRTKVLIVPASRIKTWWVVKRLVEDCDADGGVTLPKKYGTYFQTKNAAGETIEDDVAHLYRHIIPIGNGRYRLAREMKKALRRDK